jgi:hypothetical protein
MKSPISSNVNGRLDSGSNATRLNIRSAELMMGFEDALAIAGRLSRLLLVAGLFFSN